MEIDTYINELKPLSLVDLFAQNPNRAQEFSVSAGALFLDYSKNLVDRNLLELLANRLEKLEFSALRDRLLTGDIINHTENRPAHHTLLRQPPAVLPSFITTARIAEQKFITKLRDGSYRGFTNLPITNLVNIGIGGSHLGSELVVTALAEADSPIKVHFLANLDPKAASDILKPLNPAQTIFIIASKTFTTLETIHNAKLAQSWLQSHGCPENKLQLHFAAVTAAPERAKKFAISDELTFPMWDFVGGRYSLWSAIGLPIAASIGWEGYSELLAGAYTIDQHFASAPLNANMPVIMAMLSYYYQNYFGTTTHAVIPYAQRLARLVPYLQQLTMESNGKSCTRDGKLVEHHSAPVLWGDVGSNGQHAFHQLLHQGTHIVPIDFILPRASDADQYSHSLLQASCLAQARSLMIGSPASSKMHQHCPGNRPSNMLLLERIDARNLGALLALYEHKTFTESVFYGVNPFDQFGVELGKKMAKDLVPLLISKNRECALQLDPSTANLIGML